MRILRQSAYDINRFYWLIGETNSQEDNFAVEETKIGQCLYDCDDDGACDWMTIHCYDLDYNIISPDCPESISPTPIDNCFPNFNYPNYLIEDYYNNLTGDLIPDGIPDCLDDFDYSIFSNPLQTDSDGDGIGGGVAGVARRCYVG